MFNFNIQSTFDFMKNLNFMKFQPLTSFLFSKIPLILWTQKYENFDFMKISPFFS